MRKLIVTLAVIVGIFSVSNAVVPDLLVNGIAIDQSQYRMNGEDEDFLFEFHSSTQEWSLLSDTQLDQGTKPSFGLYTESNNGFGHSMNNSIIFNKKSANTGNYVTNFSAGTDVGFWLSQDITVNSEVNGYNSIYYSQRGRSVNDKLSRYQSFIMYDVRNFGDAEFSFGEWTGRGNYDYLLFIDDKITDSIDHDDMVVGLMVAPEPGTLLLLASGLIGTGLAIRRKKKIE